MLFRFHENNNCWRYSRKLMSIIMTEVKMVLSKFVGFCLASKMTPSPPAYHHDHDSMVQGWSSWGDDEGCSSSVDLPRVFHSQVHTLFFKRKPFFSTQPQYCLTFAWTEFQILLSCCLIHISMIILRHFLYSLYLRLSLDLGLFM